MIATATLTPFIDTSKKPAIPSLWLCKPNKKILHKIKYADNIVVNLRSTKTNSLSELTFNIPKKITRKDGSLIRYSIYDLLKIKYLVKCVAEWGTDYYIIDAPAKQDDTDTATIHAFLYPQVLASKKVYGFSTLHEIEVTTTTTVAPTDAGEDTNDDTDDETETEEVDVPIRIEEALNFVLSDCYSWSVEHIDNSLLTKTASFSADDATVYDEINDIASKFNALIRWDTVHNQINFYDLDSWEDVNRGFIINRRRYLQTLEEDVSADGTMISRLHCVGADGVNLSTANPTGYDYLENYDYFIGDYQTDIKGNVIKHSEYMSDELCQALIDYQDKIKSYQSDYDKWQSDLATNESTLNDLETKLTQYQSDLAEIQDKVNSATQDNNYFYYDYKYAGVGFYQFTKLTDQDYYIVIAKSTNPVNVRIDGKDYQVENSWKVIRKFQAIAPQTDDSADTDDTTDTDPIASMDINMPSHLPNNEIQIIICPVDEDEYKNYSDDILNFEYNQYLKQNEINDVNSQIADVNKKIATDQAEIKKINDALSHENNFSRDLLSELDEFVIDETYSNSDVIDAKTLMSAGQLQLESLLHPIKTFQITLQNFLQVVECQRDWDRLYLDDIVKIEYDDNTKIKANVNEMDIDFSNASINLTISNVVSVDDEIAFVIARMQTEKAAQAVNVKQNKWDKIDVTRKRLDRYVSSAINTNKQNIVGGLNKTEKIDALGYLSTYDDQHATRLYKGCILSTSNGGKSWNVIYSPAGINANQIVGNLMLDAQTKIIGDGVQIDKDGVTTDTDSLKVRGGISKNKLDDGLQSDIRQAVKAANAFNHMEISSTNLISRSNAIGETIDF